MSPATATGTFGQTFEHLISATNNPTDFDALNLPMTLSIDQTTGRISGLLQQVGVFNIDLAASNAAGTGLATLNLTISKASATVTLGNLTQNFDGAPKPVSVTTTPAGLSTNVLYEGNATPPTNVGSYGVVATVDSPNYTGSTAGILTVAPAVAAVTLDNLTQVYDGTPRLATATTSPAGLTVAFSYDGSTTPPTNAGSYTVVATVNSPNHIGSASGTLVISPAPIAIANSSHVYDGTPKGAASVLHAPGVFIHFSYNGGPPPTNAGSYVILSSLSGSNAVNYQSPTPATLIITKAPATVSLSNLSHTYSGTPQSANATTTPAGVAVALTYDGNSTPPTNAGSYAVAATITDPNYTGSAAGTLTIGKATAGVAISDTARVFDGAPKPVTVTTTPTGLSVVLTYDGAPAAPIAAGSYAVTATVSDANYHGSAAATLTITGPIEHVIDQTITLVSNQFTSASDGTNLGRRWRIEIPIAPITLNNGDTVRGTFQFANSARLRVADNGGGFFKVGATPGYEQVQMEFQQAGAALNTAITTSFTFQGVTGVLLGNPLTKNSVVHYPGTFFQFVQNLTTPGSAFSTQGFAYQHTLTSGGPVTITSIVAQLLADDISLEGTGYSPWAAQHGLSGQQASFDADIEADGLPNLLEYFFGTSPTISDADAQPVGRIENGEFAFRYRRDTSVIGLAHRVAVSADLVNWSAAPVATALESIDGVIEHYVVRLPMASPRLFARLEVTEAGLTFRTAPFGFQQFAIAGGSATTPTSTHFAVPFHRVDSPARVRVGRIDAFNANTITSNSAVWQPDLLNPAAPWFLRIRGGVFVGKTLPIVDITANSIRVSGADLTTFGLVPGHAFELIRGETLMSRFGSTTLLGGTSASAADNVLVRSGTTWLAYFYDTNLGFWRRTIGPATNSNNVKIAPDSGVEVLRRGPATTLTFVGQVATTPFRSAVNNAGTTVLHTGFPMDATLGALTLQTLIPGWRSGPTEAGSDLLLVKNGISWNSYFFDGTVWRHGGTGAIGNAVPIPAGSVLQLLRPGTTPGTTDLVRPLPYSP